MHVNAPKEFDQYGHQNLASERVVTCTALLMLGRAIYIAASDRF